MHSIGCCQMFTQAKAYRLFLHWLRCGIYFPLHVCLLVKVDYCSFHLFWRIQKTQHFFHAYKLEALGKVILFNVYWFRAEIKAYSFLFPYDKAALIKNEYNCIIKMEEQWTCGGSSSSSANEVFKVAEWSYAAAFDRDPKGKKKFFEELVRAIKQPLKRWHRDKMPKQQYTYFQKESYSYIAC